MSADVVFIFIFLAVQVTDNGHCPVSPASAFAIATAAAGHGSPPGKITNRSMWINPDLNWTGHLSMISIQLKI